MPQRHHRIDAHRAPRRDVTCGERHQRKERRNGDKRNRISRLHPVQNGAHSASRSRRCEDSNRDAHKSQLQALAHHDPRHIARARAQCHSNAHFARALLDRIRHHSINSDCAEQHRHQAEEAGQLREDAIAGVLLIDGNFKRLNQRNRLLAINGPHGIANRRRQIRRRPCRARHNRHISTREFRRRNVDLAPRAVAHRIHLDVAHHADDRAQRALLGVFDLFADGIFLRELLPHQRFIDENDVRSARAVADRERAAAN